MGPVKPAFPIAVTPQDYDPGMSYREWLIGCAVIGVTSNPYFDPDKRVQKIIELANEVYAASQTIEPVFRRGG